MPEPIGPRYLLLVVALVVVDAILLAMVASRWDLAACERGHHQRLNGEVVWAYD